MNISPHLLIDALILTIALTITLVLRAKGNAAKKEKKLFIFSNEGVFLQNNKYFCENIDIKTWLK